MKHTGASLHRVSDPGWQRSGERELTANPDIDRTVSPVAADVCFLAIHELPTL
ncbi:MAG TPA: hypothetical protein VK206_13170 [Anaerolineales bacterium]|nr:hypothetical protein [Anaerolineales bacterium]HLO27687.1 hypothetical protein [Anaerolineales bacterium]